MRDSIRPQPLKEANRITKMLDIVFGEDRFDRRPVDIQQLAIEYSQKIAPESSIRLVEERNLRGCLGALVYSGEKPRQWGIAYHKGQSPGRRAFTIGHEFGHFVLHRRVIETDGHYTDGVYCDEKSILRRDGKGIEQEADAFAAALLMPLHDFRRQLPPTERPDFVKLGKMANRYGVSLTATVLRWLECTETRAMMIVSNEGFALWARSSEPAFKSHRFIRTKNEVFELPAKAIAVTRDFSEEAKKGIEQPMGIWFPEPCVEMCFHSDQFDQEITLLHFERAAPVFHEEAPEYDTYDRFVQNGQPASMPRR